MFADELDRIGNWYLNSVRWRNHQISEWGASHQSYAGDEAHPNPITVDEAVAESDGGLCHAERQRRRDDRKLKNASKVKRHIVRNN